MKHNYQTIAGPINTEIEISRSRFITRLDRVNNESEARLLISEVRVAHPKARHHCSAFVIGPSGEIRRSNDDGEPSGTAGTPMLETLIASELSDVVAVVTRYFGGILLGAGGLTRAYRAAVAEAVAEADALKKRVQRGLRQKLFVDVSYELAPQIEAFARRQGFSIIDTNYSATAGLTIAAPPELSHLLEEEVARLSAGSTQVKKLTTDYVDLPNQ